MKTIRWGFIGCGAVTERKSGPGFQRAENSTVTKVMRRSGEKAADYARRHKIPAWTDDAENLVHDSDVDAIYVATPPGSHLRYTRMAAAAGKPVYVEKPMARSYLECEQMVTACREAQVPLFVAYYRRTLPRFIEVKEWLSQDRIGDIHSVSILQTQPPSADDTNRNAPPWRLNSDLSGGGKFVDLACHTLDILDFLLGPISDISGEADNRGGLYPVEDTVSARFRFASGIPAVGLWSYIAHETIDRVEILGSCGKITISTFGNSPILLVSRQEAESLVIPNPDPIQQPLIQSIVDQLNGCGICPSSGESAARTSLVMDRILHKWRDTSRVSFPY